MLKDDLLPLDEAAHIIRRPKREVRELVRQGRLPAVRRDAKWMVQRSDLLAFTPGTAIAAGADVSTIAPKVSAHGTGAATPRDEILAFISLLRDRDEQLALLQDERARLTGQVGYLQAQLTERDARLAAIESTRMEPPRALPAVANDGERSSAEANMPGSRIVALAEFTTGTADRTLDAVTTSSSNLDPSALAQAAPEREHRDPATAAAPPHNVVVPGDSPVIAAGDERRDDKVTVDKRVHDAMPLSDIAGRESAIARSRAIVKSIGRMFRRPRH